ncbi:MAG: hypothetical protein KGM96_12880 [Acidobacteriota bacterium]|nr:hypothetical protein [Acidobacteriota bacterium]
MIVLSLLLYGSGLDVEVIGILPRKMVASMVVTICLPAAGYTVPFWRGITQDACGSIRHATHFSPKSSMLFCDDTDMATHRREQFQQIVDILNMLWKGKMSFQLVGSLSQKSNGNDADIVVTPPPGFPGGIEVEGFVRACRETGIEIVEVDRDSKDPQPGRPDGQDRIQLKFPGGQVIDLFFPKGKK